MGQASRKKRERRQLNLKKADMAKLQEASFAHNYKLAKSSGRLIPVECAEVLSYPARYAALFVPSQEWLELVNVVGEDDYTLFEPASIQYVMYGQIGRIGECLLFTDSCLTPENRTLEYTCAVMR